MIQETVKEFFHTDWGEELLVEPVSIEDGFVEVPGRPGLGVELDEDVLREHELAQCAASRNT